MVPAVFGGMEFRAARRAKENSPAIYRWGTIATGKVPEEGVTKFKMSTIDFIDQNAFFLNSPFDLRIDF